MKKIIFSALLAVIVVAAIAFAEFFPTVIVTGIAGKWTDTRAYATLAAAVTAVGGNERIIIIVGEEAVGTLTIPINVRLKFMSNGSLAVATQLTLQTYDIEGGEHEIFSGAGDIDFPAGSVVRSGWFNNLDEALDVTSDDTLTMVISRAETLTADCVVGDNVTLRWESPLIITSTGFDLTNLKKVEAGCYQIFGVSAADDFDWLAGSVVNSSWFVGLPEAIVTTSDENTEITILVDQPEEIDTDTTIDAYQTLEIKRGCIVTITTGDTFTIQSSVIAGPYQIFNPVGTGVPTLNLNTKEILPEWWGAVSDGVTDDGPEIRAALTAMTAGSKIVFNGGSYAVTGTTGIPITKSLHWYMNPGSKLLFSDDNTVYVKPNGVTGLVFENLTVDAGAPAIRGTDAALHMIDCNETFVYNLRVLSCAGAGYLVYDGADHFISDSQVNDTLADGFHWTHTAIRFVGNNLIAEDTGDDSFAIVGYVADGGRVHKGVLTGLVARDSAADMLRIAGGDGIVVTGFYGNTSTVHGIIVCKDDTYNTYSTINTIVTAAVVTSAGSEGVVVTNDANDVTIEATVISSGGRGFNIGKSGETIERITISGSVYLSGSIGFQANYVDRLTIPYMNVYNSVTHGIFLGVINELNAGPLLAYDSNTGADGVSDNVSISGVVNGVFSSIIAHDDTGQVHRAVDIVNADDCRFGPVEYSGFTAGTGFAVNQVNCTSLQLFNSPQATFASADATPSIVGGSLCATSNGAGTVITMLDEGREGQVVKIVIGDANTTIDFTGTNLKGNLGADWSPESGDWMECVFDGTDWYCSVHDCTP